MDCSDFIDRLDGFLEGGLEAGERRAVEEHLRACPACRELEVLARREPGEPSAPPPEGLIRSVLDRTSGSTCESARARLCEHVDGTLEPLDHELVGLHLEGCDDCGGLSRVLKRASAELPALAEIDPGADLVGRVLAATTMRPSPTARLAGWFARLAGRPRLALEGAYVMTALFVLLFGTPAVPVAAARAAVERVTTRAVTEIEPPAARLADDTARTYRSFAARMGRLYDAALDAFESSAGTLLGRDASGQETNTADPATEPDGRSRGDER